MFNASLEIKKFHDDKVLLPSEERKNMRQRRDANRERLKKALVEQKKPLPIGMYSQGSYAMRTMVQDVDKDYDIDDGIYFDREKLIGPKGGELSALAVRQMICDGLQSDLFKVAPKVLKNCVRVYYNEGFHVDVPAYRQTEVDDPWSGGKVKQYELASADWKVSDPRAVTNWFREQNQTLSPDYDSGDGQFSRVVRLIKLFSRSRISWKQSTASGFMITKLASECFYQCLGRDDESLRSTMRAIANRLSVNKEVAHPVLFDEKISKEGDGRPEFLMQKLDENLPHLDVLDLHDCNHPDAMKAWGKVFNTSWFDDQPEPEGGSQKKEGFEPSAPVVKVGGGRYA